LLFSEFLPDFTEISSYWNLAEIFGVESLWTLKKMILTEKHEKITKKYF
jgi:hypothetical protein